MKALLKPVFLPVMKTHVALYEFVGTVGLVTAAVPPERKYQAHEETTSW